MNKSEQPHIFTREGEKLKTSFFTNLHSRVNLDASVIHPNLDQELQIRLK